LPNVESFLTLIVDDDHLRGIFRVFDIDHSDEFDGFPVPSLPITSIELSGSMSQVPLIEKFEAARGPIVKL
jgi:hypothetical protein